LLQEKKKARSKKRKVPNSPLIEPAGKRLSDEHAKKAGISKLPRVRKTRILQILTLFFSLLLEKRTDPLADRHIQLPHRKSQPSTFTFPVYSHINKQIAKSYFYGFI